MGDERRILSYEVDWNHSGDQLTLVLKQLTPMRISNAASRVPRSKGRRRNRRSVRG